jgi:hypothetical protein
LNSAGYATPAEKLSIGTCFHGSGARGYLNNPATEKAKVKAVIDAAIAKGIYVVIGWHDHSASSHAGQAHTCFREMAQTYGYFCCCWVTEAKCCRWQENDPCCPGSAVLVKLI